VPDRADFHGGVLREGHGSAPVPRGPHGAPGAEPSAASTEPAPITHNHDFSARSTFRTSGRPPSRPRLLPWVNRRLDAAAFVNERESDCDPPVACPHGLGGIVMNRVFAARLLSSFVLASVACSPSACGGLECRRAMPRTRTWGVPSRRRRCRRGRLRRRDRSARNSVDAARRTCTRIRERSFRRSDARVERFGPHTVRTSASASLPRGDVNGDGFAGRARGSPICNDGGTGDEGLARLYLDRRAA